MTELIVKLLESVPALPGDLVASPSCEEAPSLCVDAVLSTEFWSESMPMPTVPSPVLFPDPPEKEEEVTVLHIR